MRSLGLSAAVLITCMAHPAAACLNDSEIQQAEGEFRARYAVSASPAEPGRWSAPIGSVLGAGAILSAAGVLLWWRRAGRG